MFEILESVFPGFGIPVLRWLLFAIILLAGDIVLSVLISLLIKRKKRIGGHMTDFLTIFAVLVPSIAFLSIVTAISHTNVFSKPFFELLLWITVFQIVFSIFIRFYFSGAFGKKHGIPPKAIVVPALFVAMSIVLTRLFGFQIAGIVRLSLGSVPIMLAGIMYGTSGGAVVGFLADFVGYIINPMGGAPFPGFTLTSMANGIVPSMLPKKFLLNKLAIFAMIVLTGIITTLMNSFWLMIYMGSNTFLGYLSIRIVPGLINAVLNAVCVSAITSVPVLSRITYENRNRNE